MKGLLIVKHCLDVAAIFFDRILLVPNPSIAAFKHLLCVCSHFAGAKTETHTEPQ